MTQLGPESGRFGHERQFGSCCDFLPFVCLSTPESDTSRRSFRKLQRTDRSDCGLDGWTGSTSDESVPKASRNEPSVPDRGITPQFDTVAWKSGGRLLRPGRNMAEKLLPTPCVGMPSRALRVVPSRQGAAERPRRDSHAERGNESPDFAAAVQASLRAANPAGAEPRSDRATATTHFINQLRHCSRSRALATQPASFNRPSTQSLETGRG